MSKFGKLGRAALAGIAASTLAVSLAACAPAETETAETTEPAETSELQTLTPGKLTIGTGLPAYEPWVVGDAPESGEGDRKSTRLNSSH